MATIPEIQDYVKREYGFTPKTCWIAHVKEMCGINVKKAWNRRADERSNPCPSDKIECIKDALKHFKMT